MPYSTRANFLVVTALLLFGNDLYAQADSQQLEFGWPVPVEVKVREKSFKRGKSAEFGYVAALKRHENGKDIVITLKDFEFLSLPVAGLDLSQPEVQKALAPVLAMTSAIPKITINSKGELVEVEDVTAMITRMVEYMEKQKHLNQEVVKSIKQLHKNPQAKAILEQNAVEFWNVWVGAWLFLDEPPSPKTTEEYVFDRPLPNGKSLESRLKVTHHGFLKDNAGHIRLTSEEVIDGDPAKQMLGGLMRAMVGALKSKDDSGFEDFLKKAKTSMTTRGEVITDPKNLRPTYAKSEKIMMIQAPKEEAKKQVERKEYWFNWDSKKKKSE